MQIKILAFCGSSRRDSLNQKLLDTAVLGALDAGAQVSNIRLRDFPLPIYDGDWETEHELPERARALKALIADHHGLLIATPEHNGGYTALLKNALDWASRPIESDPTGLEVFAGKVAAMVSASPGVLGGMRAQIALQISLNKLGLLVIPNSFWLIRPLMRNGRSRTPMPIGVSVGSAQRLSGRPALLRHSRITVSAGPILTKPFPSAPRAGVSAEWLISLASDEA
jgi:chromate reductase, NAD(P)H dehydrogenase (quinone)